MRKILIILLILIVTMSILWIFAGRQIVELVDRFTTAEIESVPIESILYEPTSEEGGRLVANNHPLTLSPLNPHVGSTKDNQLAIAYGGKVFAFGPLGAMDMEPLIADIPKADRAFFVTRQSCVAWPQFHGITRLRLNRNHYYELISKKSDGTKLEMLWSSDVETNFNSLIRIEISNAHSINRN